MRYTQKFQTGSEVMTVSGAGIVRDFHFGTGQYAIHLHGTYPTDQEWFDFDEIEKIN